MIKIVSKWLQSAAEGGCAANIVKDNFPLTLLLNGRHDLWKLNLGLLYLLL